MPQMFKQIRWQLAFSYTATTIVTFLVLEACIIGLAFWFIGSNSLCYRIVHELKENVAPQAAQYLQGPTPQQNELRRWLESAFSPDPSLEIGQGGLQIGRAPLGGEGRLIIVDAHSRLLAVTPIGEPSDVSVWADIPDLTPFLHRALMGEETPSRLCSRWPDGNLLTAVPIKDAEGKVVGALVGVFHLPVSLPLFLASFLRTGGITLTMLILPVGVIGTIAGLLFSRPLARRLERLVKVTEVWKEGKLSTRIEDRKEDELGQLASHLDHMASRLQNLLLVQTEVAILKERSRIARDLHDTLKQHLFALDMQVATLRALLDQGKWETARDFLPEISSLLSEARKELTEVLHNLQLASLEKGLVQALRDYLNTWSRQTGIATVFHTEDLPTLHPTIAETLFLIAREALTNVARHSGASRVEVALNQRNGAIILRVADNGVGFDPACVEGKGVGLASMRERAHNLEGTLILESTPNQGTEVRVYIPLLEG